MLPSLEIDRKWEGIAQGKAALKTGRCLLLAVLAGMFIAFGALGFTVAKANIAGGMGKFVGACVFPTGLILVVMAGAELFTGNCLMAGPAVKKTIKVSGMLRNWGLVYLGNMAGAYLMACIVLLSGFMKNGDLALAAAGIAADKCSLTFRNALFRGIGCNVLVCGAVWMASGAKDAVGKAVCCFFPIMLFVLCGLEHSVANMYYVPLGLNMRWAVEGGLLAREISDAVKGYDHFWAMTSLRHYLLNNLLPVTLGNIIGGAGLAMVYAAIHREKRA